jgi:hypothetical protein
MLLLDFAAFLLTESFALLEEELLDERERANMPFRCRFPDNASIESLSGILGPDRGPAAKKDAIVFCSL